MSNTCRDISFNLDVQCGSNYDSIIPEGIYISSTLMKQLQEKHSTVIGSERGTHYLSIPLYEANLPEDNMIMGTGRYVDIIKKMKGLKAPEHKPENHAVLFYPEEGESFDNVMRKIYEALYNG